MTPSLKEQAEGELAEATGEAGVSEWLVLCRGASFRRVLNSVECQEQEPGSEGLPAWASLLGKRL